jgi:hypothetical protein
MGMNYDEVVKGRKLPDKKEEEEKKKIQSSVTESSYKTTFLTKLRHTLMPNDPRDVIADYFWRRWMPGVRDAVCDILVDMVDGFFRDATNGRVSSRRSSSLRSSLNDSRVGRREAENTPLSWREWDRWTFNERYDAEMVAIDLQNHVTKYDGNLSMREYFEYFGKPANFTTCRYGWKGLDPDDIRVIPYGGGWKIELPRPTEI